MEGRVIALCAVGGVLGLVSVILGFAAEGTRIKPSPFCVHPSSPALGLAISAGVILILSQVLLAIGNGCCVCCRENPNEKPPKLTLSIIMSVTSWITFAIALIFFFLGAIVNGSGGQEGMGRDDGYECVYLKPGVFAGASVLALAAVSLAIGTVALLPTATMGSSQYPQGVEIGHPQFPTPLSQTPPVYPPMYISAPQFSPQTNQPVFSVQKLGHNKG